MSTSVRSPVAVGANATTGAADATRSAGASRGPRALILRAAGTNCDGETAHALRLAGADPVVLHLHRVLEKPRLLEDFDLMVVPGGFSYGDDLGAGRVFADRLVGRTSALGEGLRRFVDAGKPIAGICNGFQVLIQTHLLPGDMGEGAAVRASGGGRLCTLTGNAHGQFTCRWVGLRRIARHCIWTSGWGREETVDLPIAHAEGRFVAAGPEALRRLEEAGRLAVRYSPASTLVASPDQPTNPNGSDGDIAGICDASGLVIGLMPHPERYVEPLQHPAWTRRQAAGEREHLAPAGLRFFSAAVAHAAARR